MTGTQISSLFSHIKPDELPKYITAHPWCAPAQLYLLHKLSDSAEFDKQALKTGLYFTNSQWLNWQLHLLRQKEETVDTPTTLENDEVIAFEPLHTVDYFASQGIKITEEPVSNDKLGKQLKSFTEWLKSMKKVHAQPLVPENESADKKIQSIAENSNKQAEVVTEAMAEVLEKQGKSVKAIEVYEKLSLTDPSKSAYFAAKIERLKTP